MRYLRPPRVQPAVRGGAVRNLPDVRRLHRPHERGSCRALPY